MMGVGLHPIQHFGKECEQCQRAWHASTGAVKDASRRAERIVDATHAGPQSSSLAHCNQIERRLVMRFMIAIESQYPVPQEMLPTLVEGFVAWWDRYRDRWEAAGFYAGGQGGGGICNCADTAEFNAMMQEWPFAPFSRFEVHALVDMDTALNQWQATIAGAQASA
jgi:hypothetical protein